MFIDTWHRFSEKFKVSNFSSQNKSKSTHVSTSRLLDLNLFQIHGPN